MRTTLRTLATVLFTAALAAAVGAGGAVPAAGSDELGDPLPDVREGRVQVGLRLVTDGVTAPLAGITAPGLPGEMFVVDQVGSLWSIDTGAGGHVEPVEVLNVAALLAGPVDPKDERGFLGAAFSPHSPTLYTYTSERLTTQPGPVHYSTIPAVNPCDRRLQAVADHRSVIRAWDVVVAPGGTTTVEDAATSEVLLTIDQPQSNHNAGDLHFGPLDGMLYISVGDGGGADDQDCQENFDGLPMIGHGPTGNGQDATTPLGDILRIDVSDPTVEPYGIPAGNLADSMSGAAPEIYAMGFRNPFRFSFDTPTAGVQELWTGDVGQNDVEEVDVVRAGGNYGWRVREGAFAFDPSEFDLKGSRSDAFVTRRASGPPFEDPVAQYDHDDGTAVIGGYVYRGSAIPALRGVYVFGDTSRRLNNGHGRLFATPADGRAPTGNEVVELRDGPLDFQLIGFGQDTDHELYALVFGFDGEAGETGAVLRLTRR